MSFMSCAQRSYLAQLRFDILPLDIETDNKKHNHTLITIINKLDLNMLNQIHALQ